MLIEEGYPATLVAQAVARAERLERFYSLPSEPSLGDNYEGIVFRTLAWARATRRMQP